MTNVPSTAGCDLRFRAGILGILSRIGSGEITGAGSAGTEGPGSDCVKELFVGVMPEKTGMGTGLGM